ncbi:hypothetical protein [Paludibaculum fermentans]|nr:hypothetical protein [Paludibaculum fermentans]
MKPGSREDTLQRLGYIERSDWRDMTRYVANRIRSLSSGAH